MTTEERKRMMMHVTPTREVCCECGIVSTVGFFVPNEMWSAVVPADRQEAVLCLRCFTRWADQKNIAWDKDIQFFPVSRKTHREFVYGCYDQQDELQRRAETAEINLAYQRRHRGWALKKAKEWRENANFCWKNGETALADIMYESEQFKAERDKLAQRVKELERVLSDIRHVTRKEMQEHVLFPWSCIAQIESWTRAAPEEKP